MWHKEKNRYIYKKSGITKAIMNYSFKKTLDTNVIFDNQNHK